MTKKVSQSYDEGSVEVLKGLKPVQKNPGMYTFTDTPTHICQEVIDNSVDEALAGYASEITVTIHEDGSLSCADNGRGIPVGLHPVEKISVLELVFTQLYAGGKFKKKENGAYVFSGGLHGVGVSVTNALSEHLEVEVRRDGGLWKMSFANGDIETPLKKIEKLPKGSEKETGTCVRVWPNGKYFDENKYDVRQLERLLKAKAVLLPGLKITFVVEKSDKYEAREEVWHYPEGLSQYLGDLLAESETLIPVISGSNYIGDDAQSDFMEGEGAEFALSWVTAGEVVKESYVNLIPTPLGGTHESGLKQSLFNAISRFITHHSLLPRNVKLQSEDVFHSLAFVLSARIVDPQFLGQTKDKFTKRDAVKLMDICLTDRFEHWLNTHIEEGKKISEFVIQQAMSRMRSQKKVVKKKGSGVAVLPGKLTDCESEDIRENELFLVEGDSAGGSAKLARDRSTQAILPLRGKVLNSFEVNRDHLFANQEIHDISVAIGVDPHKKGEDVDLSSLRYGKIAILSDADVDGSHIQVLLLTLFYTHFPKLIEDGHIFIAQPPLFRVDIQRTGKKKGLQKIYALDQNELNSILEKLKKENISEKNYAISRFKGLGEMNPEQLKDTTMNPDTRRLVKVTIPEDEGEETKNVFVKLMGKGEAAQRRAWMEENGDKVEADV